MAVTHNCSICYVIVADHVAMASYFGKETEVKIAKDIISVLLLLSDKSIVILM